MYVDVLLVENFIINLVILNITARFSKIKTTKKKLALGAALGALYVLVVFFPSLEMLLTLAMKIAVSVLMVIIVFAPDRFKDFFKALAIFYIITFALGGAAFALFYLSGQGKIMNGILYISNINNFPVSLLIMGIGLGYLLLVFCWDYIQNRIISDELIYDVIIELNNKKIEVNAILDTGNSLKDPISNLPVIVVEYEAIKQALPDKMSAIFNNSRDDISYEKLCNVLEKTDLLFKIRLIPFSTLGRQNGMLIGIKPDNVRLTGKKCKREIKDVVIGICNNKISKTGEYKALLYPEILR
jgi:stage II sporulation protein GA (sporulation sigma-E factor processing peptidase)